MILEDILNIDANIFSFDIFDTVVTRTVGKATGIFALMKGILSASKVELPKHILQDFVNLRIAAEKKARKLVQAEEITIADIYDTFLCDSNFQSDLKEFLMNLEINTELLNVNPVNEIIKSIEILRKKGKRIIFVSDMYLPKSVIIQMLEKVKVYREGDGLYLSSEFYKTKSTGRLFQVMLNMEKCSPKDICHIGDNKLSDVKMPKKIGIKSFYFRDSKLNRYERIYCENKEVSETFGESFCNLLAGEVRWKRLNKIVENLSGHDREIYNIGLNVAGATLVPYVIWLLQEAQKQNLQRLYFLSGDGEVLLKIAEKINSVLCADIQFRYLYASRQAWHFPSITEISEREMLWMFIEDPILSIEIFANRVHLNAAFITSCYERFTGSFLKPSASMNELHIESLKRMLRDNYSGLRDMILEKAALERENMLGYLSQEGVTKDISCGLVDMGWHGNMRDSLLKILHCSEISSEHIQFFYFGLVTKEDHRESFLNVRNSSFLFNGEKKDRFIDVGVDAINILEIFTDRKHGLVLSYEQTSEERYCAKLKTPLNQNTIDWGIGYLRNGIFDFLSGFLQIFPKGKIEHVDKLGSMIAEVLKQLVYNPTQEEAEVLGEYLFSSDQSETKFLKFAPKFSFLKSFRYLVNSDSRDTLWLRGTRSRSGWLSKILLSYKVYNNVKKIKRFFKIKK